MMSRNLAILLAAALCVMTLGSVQADQKLTGAEIVGLLADRTALGNWRGTPTRQYFAKGGTTSYLAEGSPSDPGKWRVDMATDQYCSLWQRGGWSCYDIETDGKEYFWVSPGSGYRSPFTMTDGRKMSF